MDEATPRVTMPLLEQFQHRTVRILGRVTQLRGEQAAIDAGGQISLHLNRVCDGFVFCSSKSLACECISLLTPSLKDAHLTLNHAVEIVGKVQNDLSVRVLASTDFGVGIGMDAPDS